MKRIFLIALMAVVGMCATVGAQNLRDRSGSYMGQIDSNGNVRDRSGSYIGQIDNNGNVRDRSGSLKGRVESDGTLRDRSGSYMGKFDGKVQRKYAAAILFFELL
ncbi:MAG: hypothetical protein Q4B68_04995 [Bacteroidales bacterium]|nr:hypothetical protein [Bacteroidales bacterium]